MFAVFLWFGRGPCNALGVSYSYSECVVSWKERTITINRSRQEWTVNLFLFTTRRDGTYQFICFSTGRDGTLFCLTTGWDGTPNPGNKNGRRASLRLLFSLLVVLYVGWLSLAVVVLEAVLLALLWSKVVAGSRGWWWWTRW